MESVGMMFRQCILSSSALSRKHRDASASVAIVSGAVKYCHCRKTHGHKMREDFDRTLTENLRARKSRN
jgi:hypothetical protein